jgi:hypothetical protein
MHACTVGRVNIDSQACMRMNVMRMMRWQIPTMATDKYTLGRSKRPIDLKLYHIQYRDLYISSNFQYIRHYWQQDCACFWKRIYTSSHGHITNVHIVSTCEMRVSKSWWIHTQVQQSRIYNMQTEQQCMYTNLCTNLCTLNLGKPIHNMTTNICWTKSWCWQQTFHCSAQQ